MNTYLVTWSEVVIHGTHIEAESEQDALDKFRKDDYDWGSTRIIDSDGVIEGSEEAELV